MIAKRLSAWLLLVLMPILAACSDSSSVSSNTALLQVAAEACRAATTSTATLCRSECTRLADMQASAQCNVSCDEEEQASRSLCGSPPTAFERDCQRDNCPDDVMSCLDESGAGFDRCTESCATGNDFCANQCLARRAAEEHSCGFLPVPLNRGGIALPALAPGQPAHLSALLDDDEIAVVEAADRRSADHRQRSVRLWIDAAETPISITQIEHDFSFGVPLDSREFADGDGRLAFYSEIARPHANLLVAETSLKWRNTEREQGQLTFDLADFELDWAESLGFDIKAHVLLWGN
ncbi:MAG: endo-1,4-beta-xylanase, partial [Pseudomonadota bacterium]